MTRTAPVKLASALVLPALFWSAPAAAQVDFIRQDIVVDVTAPTLRVEVELEVEVTGPSHGIWTLTPSLAIESATADGEPVTAEPHSSTPIATGLLIDDELPVGERIVFHVVLADAPTCSEGLYQACAYDADMVALLPSTPSFTWHLTNLLEDHDGYVGSIRVRAPEGLDVTAGQGAPRSVEARPDSTVEWTFGMDTPTIAPFVYARAAETVRLESGDRTLVATPPPGGNETIGMRMHRALEVMAGVLPIYESRFGPLPVDEIHVMSTPARFPFAGMGLLGNVFMGEPIFADSRFTYLLEQGAAHELAHSWWGHLVPAAEPAEALVLQEGMAEYSAWLALGELWGDDARTAGARMNSVWYMYRRPGGMDLAAVDPQVGNSPVGIHVGYHKGAQAWRAIATAAGEDRFVDALSGLVDGGDAATIADLVDALQALGYDARGDVAQWLEAPGFPVVTAATAFDDEGACLSLEVDGDFHLTFPVVLRHADGSASEHSLPLTPGDNEACLPRTDDVIAIELDPRWTMPREVRPAVAGDVTLDGEVDAVDLMAVALHQGTALPDERRVDGGYDPLYDPDADREVDAADLQAVRAAISRP